MNGHFTGNNAIAPGTVVSIVIICILLIVAVVAIAAGVLADREANDSEIPNAAIIGFGILVGFVTVVGFGFGMYPYGYDYHHYREYTGTVTQIESRLLSNDNKGTDQKYVVHFLNGDNDYGCDDTRCSLIKPNDTLTLTCKLTFQWNGSPGEDCNFVSRG